MSSLIRRYLGRELLQYWLVFTLVLWLVLVTARLSLYLGQAAAGRLPAEVVLDLLVLKSVAFFVFLLPLTLFLGLLWLFGRLNRDFETLAFGAAGVGLWQLYRAIAMPVFVAVLAVGLLSLYLVPLTAQQGYRLRAESQQHLDASQLTAGRFHSLRNGQWLLYAARPGRREGELDDVFVHVQRGGRSRVLVARHALLRDGATGGERFLVLQDGYRYDGSPGQADYRVLRYAEYGVRLRPRPANPGQKWDAAGTADLWGDTRPAARAELQTRLSRPLSVLVLALIAVPLGRFRPATGRFYPLWLGVPVFALYFNLLATAGLWVARQSVPQWLGVWWVHALFVIGLLVALRPWRSWSRVSP